MAIKRRTSAKSPPIFSHEFIVQNHADIVSCLAMLIVVGLLFQVTSPLATLFITLQHNVTEITYTNPNIPYTRGPLDVFIVFFYFLIAIVIHAVLQEYVLDKINRKLNLSKTKHSKFNESGQLLTFFVVSMLWAAEILRRGGFAFDLRQIWVGYPDTHVQLPYMTKFFWIIQMSYWLHCLPEVYFMKVKREEWINRITYASLYTIFIAAAYYLHFTKLALVLLTLHYFAEALFHVSRLLYFSNKTKVYRYTFQVWNVLFVFIRFLTLLLAVVTFWYGLKPGVYDRELSEIEKLSESTAYNTSFIKIIALVAVGLLQVWMMWNFVTFHLRRRRDRAFELARKRQRQQQQLQKKVKEPELDSELPEADQQLKKPVAVASGKLQKLKVK